jgi:hypothetical protein
MMRMTKEARLLYLVMISIYQGMTDFHILENLESFLVLAFISYLVFY